MSRVKWSRRAVRDLFEIGSFIASDDRSAAQRWVQRLRQRAALAAVSPLSGRIVPEVNRHDVREVFVKTYRIVYVVLPHQIAVLTVFEGHSQIPKDLALAGRHRARSKRDPGSRR